MSTDADVASRAERTPTPIGSTRPPSDHPYLAALNARTGFYLFVFYLVCYATFVLLHAFRPDVMQTTMLDLRKTSDPAKQQVTMYDPIAFQQVDVSSINLALLSAFGLMLLAIVLSALYMFLCRRNWYRFAKHWETIRFTDQLAEQNSSAHG